MWANKQHPRLTNKVDDLFNDSYKRSPLHSTRRYSVADRQLRSMCPSVWLTLDVLASQQSGQQSEVGSSPALKQFVGSWLDKLKANRFGEDRGAAVGGVGGIGGGGGNEELSGNVQLGVQLSSVEEVGGKVKGEKEDGLEVGANKKKRKKKKVRVGNKEVFLEDMADVEELKPLVDCR